MIMRYAMVMHPCTPSMRGIGVDAFGFAEHCSGE